MKLTCNVTSEILENASQESSRKCIVAEAVKKKLRTVYGKANVSGIDVTSETIRYNLKDDDGVIKKYIFLTPAKAAVKIVRFDEDGPESIKPFSLLLNTANCAVMTITRRSPRKTKKGDKKRKHNQTCYRARSYRESGVKVIVEKEDN